RNLRGGTYTLGFSLTAPGGGESIHVLVTRYNGGPIINWVTIKKGILSRRHCGGLESTWSNPHNFISVHIPWQCLDELRTSLSVQTSFGKGDGSSASIADRIRTVGVRYK